MTDDSSRMTADRERERRQSAHVLVRVAAVQHHEESTFAQPRVLTLAEGLRQTSDRLVRVAAVPFVMRVNTLRLVNSSGTLVWKRHQYQGVSSPAGTVRTTSLAVSGDVIVSGSVQNASNEHAVVAWNPSGGKLWSYDAAVGNIGQIVVLSNGNFVCSSALTDDIFGLRASDGALLWTNTDPTGSNNPRSWMATNGTDVAVVGDDGSETHTFWRIDGTDGSTDFSDSYTLPSGGQPYNAICAGGFGVYTAHRIDTSANERFEGLDADGALNGTAFTIASNGNPAVILPSPAGNLLIATGSGKIEERNSSGTLLQSDTTTFGNFGGNQPALAVDDAGNIYAFANETSGGSGLLVKYDGDDLTTIDWQHTVKSTAALPTCIALHSPSSNASSVIGYTEVSG